MNEMLRTTTHRLKVIAGDFEDEKTGGLTMQSTEGPCLSGIPLGGWKTDVRRREAWTAGLDAP